MFVYVLKVYAGCSIAGELIMLANASEIAHKAIGSQYLLNDVKETSLYSGIKTKP